MLHIIRRFIKFSGKSKKLFLSTLWISLIRAIFEALKILAIAVVLYGLAENTMNMSVLFTALGIMVVSILGGFLTQRSMSMRQTEASYQMVGNKRIAIGERLKYMPMGYFNSTSLGAITSAATTTSETLQDLGAKVISACLQGTIATIIIIGLILVFDYRIGVILFIGILAFSLTNILLQRSSAKLNMAMSEGSTKLETAILEYIQGMGVVKSYNLDCDSNKKINKEIQANQELNFQMEKAFIPYVCLQSIILKIFEVVMMLLSIWFYLSGSMELVTCLLMMISSFFIYGQLETAGNNSALLRSIDKSLNIVNAVFEIPVMDEHGIDIKPSDYTIEAEHITFSYDKKNVIDDVSFTISPKTTTAIIGPSGSGKTTLCQLILRFWDVSSGKITLGGKKIDTYTFDSLMKNFSMVFQSVYLFNDTIANNIRFGNPNATREQIIDAAKQSYCHDFIISLPNGYDTMIGEGGASLSGGEKQRISIARALLKNAPIIILDEATANIDPENEQLLQASIEALTKDKTVIMIAHRLKTVQNADQILVLDNGKIVQQGTHDELMKTNGLYSKFIGMREKTVGWKLGKVVGASHD